MIAFPGVIAPLNAITRRWPVAGDRWPVAGV